MVEDPKSVKSVRPVTYQQPIVEIITAAVDYD